MNRFKSGLRLFKSPELISSEAFFFVRGLKIMKKVVVKWIVFNRKQIKIFCHKKCHTFSQKANCYKIY